MAQHQAQCRECVRLWRQATAAYNDGLRAQLLRGSSVDPVSESGADWPEYQHARAAYEAHAAAHLAHHPGEPNSPGCGFAVG